MKAGVEDRLAGEGLGAWEASRKAALFRKAADALRRLRGAAPADPRRWFVPGRIEVLGKHTDYAGGRSLLCTVERGLCVIASARSDRRVHIVVAPDGAQADLALEPDLVPRACGWTIFPMTVTRRITRNFPGDLCGADIAFASDLPRAAGLSSSSALVVALFTALADVNALEQRAQFTANIRSREDLAGYLGCLENGQTFRALEGDRGVGTFGGSEDHTAILCCRPGQLAQYTFCPVRHERSITLAEGLTFVVAASGVAADKSGDAQDKYNRLSLAATVMLDLWRRATGRDDATLFAAATHAPDAPDRMRRVFSLSSTPLFSSQVLLGRFEQFLQETTAIIPAVADAFASGQFAAVGALVDRSQAAAERLLGNQTRETIALARLARELGALAASAFGGGFGGSVWALLPVEDAQAFRSRWAESYARAFPAAAARAEFFISRPGPALLRLSET